MNRRRLSAIILALVLSLPLFAQSKGENTIVFTPQWTAQAQFAGYYAALELGFYKEEGLDVVIEHPNASRSAIALCPGPRGETCEPPPNLHERIPHDCLKTRN